MNTKKKLTEIAAYFNTTPEVITKHYIKPRAEVAYIRHITFYIFFKYKPNRDIVKIFKCNHATVIYGVQKIKDYISIQDQTTLRALEVLMPGLPQPYYKRKRSSRRIFNSLTR